MKIIDELKTKSKEIKEYFENNDLDYSKFNTLGKCGNKEMLVLQYISEANGQKGLLDENPAKVVLIIRKIGNQLEFEQTEYTRKYL